jgi:hypothetical protein
MAGRTERQVVQQRQVVARIQLAVQQRQVVARIQQVVSME